MFDITFYKGKRVLITGHTGFKGSWMSRMLIDAGADVTGYSRGSYRENNLLQISEAQPYLRHIIGDIRDIKHLKEVFHDVQPEIVIHMAAQPIVRESYINPVYTYETNVLGTVNILECVRLNTCVKSFVNVTTDKVYENKEWEWGYRENDPLDGYDPYSNSKSCSDLITHCYKNSFFHEGQAAISTVRAGNVIGGGDFAPDRIIPDCVRAVMKHKEIIVRNPYSTRPFQNVLEPIYAYLMIAAKQYEDNRFSGWYNVGPDDTDCYQTGALVDLFIHYWGDGATWVNRQDGGPHEASFLKLDCSKLKKVFQWTPRWNLTQAMQKTVEWYKCWLNGGNIKECMEQQISEFLEG